MVLKYNQLPHSCIDIYITIEAFYLIKVNEDTDPDYENNLTYVENSTKQAISYKLSQNSIKILPSQPKIAVHVSNQSGKLDSDSKEELFINGKILKVPFNKDPMVEIDEFIPTEPYRRCRVFGILGFLKLLTGWHLIVLHSHELVGKIMGKNVYHTTRAQLLPFDYTLAVLAMEEDLSPSTELPIANDDASETPRYPTPNLFDRLKAAMQTSSKDYQNISTVEAKEENEDPSKTVEENVSIITSVDSKGSDVTYQTNNSPEFATSIPKDVGFKPEKEENFSKTSHSRKTSKSEDELLEARIKQEIYKLFGSEGSMYTSYDFDLTNSYQSQERIPSDNPFWKTMNTRFWWNRNLQKKLIELELHHWILPVVQGYVQTERCKIENVEFTMSIISRREINRLGMRYQRRGVNESGFVANFAETEQILEVERDRSHHRCSFVQIRGSIPLFWSQSPYSLKPIPVLERTGIENLDAFLKHQNLLKKAYGDKIYLVNLVEHIGREFIVGSAYRNYLHTAKEKSNHLEGLQMVEFDFHQETKGMRYENINKLIDQLDNGLTEVSYFWKDVNTDASLADQLGVFRTNCMDCLDRTNVVQSAFARYLVNIQLFRLGIQEHPDKGISYHEEFERLFNDIWANNGDSLSLAYAGTSALKGDFTRTGKRNFQGMFNDATNSLSRFYINAFRDFFTQAVLDYLQGHHRLDKFKEVAETHIATEPGIEDRLQKVRASAVEVSAGIVLLEDEFLIHGWTLLSPVKLNRIYHTKLEEKVMLLTTKSVYVCSFHYGLEKVIQFTRIPLERLLKIQLGDYYLTPYDERQIIPMGEPEHYGVVLHYNWDSQCDQLNTRSLRSYQPSALVNFVLGSKNKAKVETRYIALKGIPNPTQSKESNSADSASLDDLVKEPSVDINYQSPGLDLNPTIASDTSYKVIQTINLLLQQAHKHRTQEINQLKDLPVEIQTIFSVDDLRDALNKTIFGTGRFF